MAVQPITDGISASDGVHVPKPLTPQAPFASASAPLRTGAAHPAGDLNAAVLGQLSASDLANLSAILQPSQSSETALLLRHLVEDTALAAAQGDTTRAISNLNGIARLDPAHIENLRVDPILAPIRPEMERVFHQLTTTARIDAEGSLARAAQFLEASGAKMLPNWQTPPQMLVEAAHRLFEAGGYANYVRSAALAQAIVDYSPWIVNYMIPRTMKVGGTDPSTQRAPDSAVRKSWAAMRSGALAKVSLLWRRAPLLMLLLGWLAMGLAGASGSILLKILSPEAWPAGLMNDLYDLWAIGFLALVGLGFYARIRRVRP